MYQPAAVYGCEPAVKWNLNLKFETAYEESSGIAMRVQLRFSMKRV
jgi:hypothetical protein